MRAHNRHHDVLSLFIAPFDFSCRFGFATNTRACNLFLPFLCIVFCFMHTPIQICSILMMICGVLCSSNAFEHFRSKFHSHFPTQHARRVHTFHLFSPLWKEHSIKVRATEIDQCRIPFLIRKHAREKSEIMRKLSFLRSAVAVAVVVTETWWCRLLLSLISLSATAKTNSLGIAE